MPDGLIKSKKRGIYLWKKNKSEMVYIPAGNMWYGARKRKSKKVYLTAFYIDKYETTWKDYITFCEDTKINLPKKPTWGIKEYHPVVYVNYRDVLKFSRWVGKKIPTAAQWIKTARGGIKTPDFSAKSKYIPLIRNINPHRLYPWGNIKPNHPFKKEKVYRCNYCADDSFVGQGADGYMYTARIGEFSHWNSPYGCADMAGNVFEICQDWYDENYVPLQGDIDPKGPTKSSKYRVKLGGSFYSLANQCVIGVLSKFYSRRGDSQTGFRLIVPGENKK